MVEEKDRKDPEEIVLARILRLNAMIYGLVTGLVLGLGIFICTNWLILNGGEGVGPHLNLLGQVFIGYRVTFVGSLIGFAYGFGFGFLIAYFIARLYNRLVDLKEGQRQGRE